MPRILYSFILIVLQPLVLLRLWFKGRKASAYRQRILERYGFNAPRLNGCIWLHAVSVGEAITAKPVIEYLLANTDRPILVTTTTPTGADQVHRMFGERVTHRYMPQDISLCLNQLVKHCSPALLLVMETELWPNLIHLCKRKAVATMLINGRLSEKSARSYAKFGGLTAAMLRNLSALCIQTQLERQRFIDLGALPEHCVTIPSLKFEAVIDESNHKQAETLREQYQLVPRFVWIAASTHAGEDEIVLAAHKALLQKHPSALLILVPRHPERFSVVADLSDAKGMKTARYSNTEPVGDSHVWLLDKMGQLLNFYGVANVAFVGGSLNGGGGHNIMEPALWSKPVLSGPGLFNFQAVSDEMYAQGGLSIVNNDRDLFDHLQRLSGRQECALQGKKAYAVALNNKGGLALTVAQINKLLPS